MASSYDAIVIGAGVMGASIAYHLADAGLSRTLVLERDTVCSGNTRKSGALVRMHYSNQPEASLAVKSLPYFQNWSDLVGASCGFQPVGFLLLVDPGNEARLLRNVAMQQSLGINTRVVRGKELGEIHAGLVVEDGAIGAFEPESGYADPVATTHSFLRAACNYGVTVLEHAAVTGVREQGGRVVGVSSSAGEFDAPLVFCAANVWSPALLRSVGVDLDVWPLRSQNAYYRRPAVLQDRARVLLDLVQLNYSRPHGDSYLVGSPIWDHRVEDPDAYSGDNDAGFDHRQRERMRGRLPSLAEAEYLGGQAGLYDMSPDTRAILDRAPGVDGLFLAAGFSGSGFKISPMVGACLAELATRGKSTSVDIRPFRLSRFAENQPITSPDEYHIVGDWGMKW